MGLMRRISTAVVIASFCFGGAAIAGASNFWDAKPYTEWSPKELETILTDSPWVRKLSVVIQTPPRATEDGGGGGRGGGGGGDVGGRGFPVAAPQVKLTLTWRSAQPVREALARTNNSNAETVDGKPVLERPDHYLFTLSGVPARYQRLVPNAAKTSFLKRGSKPPIALLQGGIQQEGGLLTLVFAFPRTDPIVLDDKEIEFVTTIGGLEIKQKFKLKDLVVNGQLDL
jgi:hypothetical protein